MTSFSFWYHHLSVYFLLYFSWCGLNKIKFEYFWFSH